MKFQNALSLFLLSILGLTSLSGCGSKDIVTHSPMPASHSSLPVPEKSKPFLLAIDRSGKRMKILDKNGIEVNNVPIGVGRGGLRPKQDMMDLVTPTGEFVVDLILYQNEKFNRVSPQLREQYLDSQFREFFVDEQGLKKLFDNMNLLDFDGDGKSDRSYGIAYIGLNAAPTSAAITGPKMRHANWQGGGNTPYWFSIALHGTPNESSDIGKANSGGCIHVEQNVLKKLVEEGAIEIGTRVIITDNRLNSAKSP